MNDANPSKIDEVKSGSNTMPLYRFQPIDAKRLLSALKSELYFSAISEFNDPFEFFHLPVDFDPENIRTLSKHVKTLEPQYTDKDIIDYIGKQNENFEFMKSNVISLGELYRVCSFTKPPGELHPLLWSHYADKHRGWCLEYGLDLCLMADDLVSVVHKERMDLFDVHYTDVLPTFTFNDPGKSRSIIHTKQTIWEYEQECRLVSRSRLAKIKIPKQSLTGIIFGCRTCDDTVSKVMRIFQRHGFSLNYYKAEIQVGRYGLKKTPIK